MRYRAGWAVVIFFLFISLTVTAIAHPGDTDSTGGHWDSSTGSYHYHHGYPAHSHRDTDGDGYADCPYDFHDQTGSNSGVSSGNGDSSVSITVGDKHSSFDQSDASHQLTVRGVINSILLGLLFLLLGFNVTFVIYGVIFVILHSAIEWLGYHLTKSGEINMKIADNVIHILLTSILCIVISIWTANYISSSPNHIAALIIIAGIVICILALLNHGKSKELEEKDRKIQTLDHDIEKTKAELQAALKHNKDIDEMQAVVSATKQKLSQAEDQLRKTQLQVKKIETLRYRMENAPPGVTFTENGEPICGLPDEAKPYGDYTVYLSIRPTIYHTDRLCAPRSSPAAHIFHVIGSFRPCKKCAASAFPFTAVPEWYSPDK